MIIVWVGVAVVYILIASFIKETLFNLAYKIKADEPSKSEKLIMRTISVFWPIGVPAIMLWSAIVRFFED